MYVELSIPEEVDIRRTNRIRRILTTNGFRVDERGSIYPAKLPECYPFLESFDEPFAAANLYSDGSLTLLHKKNQIVANYHGKIRDLVGRVARDVG